ncbi:MAG: hypothetical protein HY551_00665 [Elusimicrobia bacterium]|nr:hypothetical protein [Elusimicrobiota bacterium]
MERWNRRSWCIIATVLLYMGPAALLARAQGGAAQQRGNPAAVNLGNLRIGWAGPAGLPQSQQLGQPNLHTDLRGRFDKPVFYVLPVLHNQLNLRAAQGRSDPIGYVRGLARTLAGPDVLANPNSPQALALLAIARAILGKRVFLENIHPEMGASVALKLNQTADRIRQGLRAQPGGGRIYAADALRRLQGAVSQLNRLGTYAALESPDQIRVLEQLFSDSMARPTLDAPHPLDRQARSPVSARETFLDLSPNGLMRPSAPGEASARGGEIDYAPRHHPGPDYDGEWDGGSVRDAFRTLRKLRQVSIRDPLFFATALRLAQAYPELKSALDARNIFLVRRESLLKEPELLSLRVPQDSRGTARELPAGGRELMILIVVVPKSGEISQLELEPALLGQAQRIVELRRRRDLDRFSPERRGVLPLTVQSSEDTEKYSMDPFFSMLLWTQRSALAVSRRLAALRRSASQPHWAALFLRPLPVE